MANRIFTRSDKVWSAMLKAISSARESIYLEAYIFDDDTKGYDILKELENCARRGLKVIVILDMVGSRTLSKSSVDLLRAAGAEVLFYSFFLRRTHRKILIVDEKTAFIGGVNIRERYSFWKDLHVRVTGKIVRPILGSFLRTYKECGGHDQIFSAGAKRGVIKSAKLWFIERGMGRKESLLRNYYNERINMAKNSITIVTPYLLPPRWLLARLHQAILRSVKVEILMPQDSDHHIANWVNRSFASFFSKLGARCYFLPGMNHAKAMLIDGKEGVIGSQNLDILSFDWNIEAGIFFHEPDMVSDLAKIIEDWKKQSTVFDPSHSKFHWYDIPIAFFLRAFGLLPLW